VEFGLKLIFRRQTNFWSWLWDTCVLHLMRNGFIFSVSVVWILMSQWD